MGEGRFKVEDINYALVLASRERRSVYLRGREKETVASPMSSFLKERKYPVRYIRIFIWAEQQRDIFMDFPLSPSWQPLDKPKGLFEFSLASETKALSLDTR